MKKAISLFLTVIMVMSAFCLTAGAEDTSVKVMLDGSYIEFDVAPVIVEGRTMVPVRAIFEALGASVDWIAETSTVVSKHGDSEIKLTIDDKILYKNGNPTELDVPAMLVDSRTLVPVRAISEAYDCAVYWNQWEQTVVIFSDLDSTAMATINDENISVGYFNFVLNQVEYYATQSFGISVDDVAAFWNTPLEDTTFGEYLISLALEQCYYTKANAQQAKASGIELSAAEVEEINSSLKEMSDIYGENYEATLKNSGTSSKAMKDFYTDNKYAEKYYNKLYEDHKMAEYKAKNYLDEKYIRAKHILFTTIDTLTGEPLSEEEKAEKLKLAESTLNRIRRGEDFDKLMNEFSEDPGTASYPDGYLFTKGEMVPEFEDAAYGLKIGSTSEIVESAYGYHIIKRVKNGEYSENDYEIVYSQVENEIREIMNSNRSAATPTYNSNILLNVIPF